MEKDANQVPTEWDSYLGAVFWQQWEDEFDGDPVEALRSAGYPADNEHGASKAMADLLSWIEEQSDIKSKIPRLQLLYDYEANGMNLLEFLVLTKNYIDGNRHAFKK